MQKVSEFIGVPLFSEGSVAWQDREEIEENIGKYPLIQECVLPVSSSNTWRAMLGAHLV